MIENEKTLKTQNSIVHTRKLDKAKATEFTLRFIIAFIVSRARILSSFSPFGAAFSASAPPGIAGAVTSIGAILGYISSGEMIWALKYISIIILIRASVFVFKNTSLYKSEFFTPLAAFLFSAIVGSVYAYDTGWDVRETMIFVVETFICGGCAYFYRVAFLPWQDVSVSAQSQLCHGVSTVILLSSLLMALSGISLFGVMSIGRTAAVIIVMLTSFRGSLGLGCACGAAIGAAMDLSSGNVPLFTMAYALSALISGIFSKNGRLLFLLSFITANAITVVWTWEYYGAIFCLYEVFAASVIFMLLPNSFFTKVTVFFPSKVSGYGYLKAREYSRERVEMTSEAFKGLFGAYRSVYNSEKNTEDPSAVFDRAADIVCRSCPKSADCWQKNAVDTYDIMNNLTPYVLNNGKIAEKDFPARFTDNCLRFPELVRIINEQIKAFTLRKLYNSRLRESHSIAFYQYADMAVLLRNLANELGSEVTVETSLERKLSKYLRGLDIDASVAVFRVGSGRLRAEIKGGSLYILRKDKDYLDKLSSVLGTRLCTSEERNLPGKLVLLEAEPYCIMAGSASIKKSGERVSGDKGVYFRTDDGIFYVLLSDGMGSGEDAAQMSSETISILERFLRAGVDTELTLSLLSDLMLLKSDSETQNATIDLLKINMFTGDARIYKYGAAPSYLKKGSVIRKVACRSFPAGLRRSDNEYAKLHLSAGDYSILLSDGIVQGGDDKWLRDMISEYSGEDPKELSRIILQKAMELTGLTDDMTVLAVRTDKRD